MSAHERFRFRTVSQLLAKASEIDAALPFSEDVGVLFSPAIIGRATLAHRLVVHPMEGADAEPTGAPSALTFRRYRRFAEGGCGLIWFEAAAVTREGQSNPHQLRLARETLDGFKRLVEETRRSAREKNPGSPDVLLVIQLTHAGRFSGPSGASAPVIARHDPYLDPLAKITPDFPLIPDESLDRLQEDFLLAARLAEEAGFDGVDLKACHGYLVAELLAARERPNSRYGGPFENRARFLVETARAIKSLIPGRLLACRLGIYDALPFPFGFGVDSNRPEVLDLSEPIEIIRRLRREGLDLLNITAGIPAFKPHFGRPYDKPAAGMATQDEHPLEGVRRLLDLAARVQRAFPELPVVGTGYSWLRQFFPSVAAGTIRDGGATLIGLGRLAIAYPRFAADLRNAGVLNPRNVCLACSGCSERLRAGGPVGCVVRDKSVYPRLATCPAR